MTCECLVILGHAFLKAEDFSNSMVVKALPVACDVLSPAFIMQSVPGCLAFQSPGKLRLRDELQPEETPKHCIPGNIRGCAIAECCQLVTLPVSNTLCCIL